MIILIFVDAFLYKASMKGMRQWVKHYRIPCTHPYTYYSCGIIIRVLVDVGVVRVKSKMEYD